MRSSRKIVRHSDHALFEPLEARQLLATIMWDGGGDGTTLTQASNWAGDVVPGAADDAIIDIAGTPTINFTSGATFSVHSLTCAENFNMTSGTLSVAAASVFSGGLTMSGGAITGVGELSIASAFAWQAGTLTGAGSTVIEPGVILTMNTAGTRVLSRTLTNNGRIEHSAGILQFGGNGTLNNSAGHQYKLTATGTITATGSTNLFNNAGVFNDQTTSTINLNLVFNNPGQLNVYGGVLNLSGGGTNSGARNLAAGAILNYRASYTHAAGSNASGSGIMNFNGGTQVISGNWTSSARLQLLSGTLDGPGDLTTTGPMIWGAGTMTGSGNITIAPTGKLALSTGATHILSRAIINNGNLHFLNGVFNMAGATITNSASGIFATLPAATISATAGVNVIDNTGLFRKMGPGTLTLDSVLGGIRMNNTGMVEVRNGALNLNGPITQITGDALNGGTWQAYPAGTLSLGASVIHLLGSTTTINLLGGGADVPNISTLSTNEGAINLSLGGVFQLFPDGGTFTNNGTIDLGPDRLLRINGNFEQSAAGQLNIHLFTNTRYSRILVSGTSALAGGLDVNLIAGFTITPPVTMNFFQSTGARTGTFDTTSIPFLPGATATLVYTPTGANLVVS